MAKGSFEGFPNPKPNKGGTNAGDATATAGQILATKTAYGPFGKIVGTMVNQPGFQAPVSIAPDGSANIWVRIPNGAYLTNMGSGFPEIQLNDPDFIAANISNGMDMFGLVGTGGNVKRWANGSNTTDGTGKLTVTGLAFQPSLIIVEAGVVRAAYKNPTVNAALNTFTYNNSGAAGVAAWTINASGFTVTGFNSSTSCSWIAIE